MPAFSARVVAYTGLPFLSHIGEVYLSLDLCLSPKQGNQVLVLLSLWSQPAPGDPGSTGCCREVL